MATVGSNTETSKKTSKPSRTSSFLRSPRLWISVALLAVAVTFVLQNTRETDVNIAWISVRSPMWFTLACSVGVGIVIGFLLRRRGR